MLGLSKVNDSLKRPYPSAPATMPPFDGPVNVPCASAATFPYCALALVDPVNWLSPLLKIVSTEVESLSGPLGSVVNLMSPAMLHSAIPPVGMITPVEPKKLRTGSGDEKIMHDD